MTTYTVKQLAELLDVTKMTVFNHAQRNKIQLKKIDNIVRIDEKQALIIAESINNQKEVQLDLDTILKHSDNHTEQSDTDNSNNHEDTSESSQQSSELNNELLNTLIKQLDQKDNQIAELQRLLSNQQSLALQSNEKIQQLENEITELKDKESVNEVTHITEHDNEKINRFYEDLRKPAKDDNKSFLSKLFKSRK